MPASSRSAAVLDGRVERSVRTRKQIALAVLDLIRGGNLNPTSHEVARYANVGHRTVFRHFQDMETLLEDVQAQVRSLVTEGLTSAPKTASLAARIEHLVEQRARVFELVTMYYLSGRLRLHDVPSVKRSQEGFARLQRQQLLESFPEAGRAAHLAEAADMISSIDAWLRLRQTQKLGVELAKNVVASTLKTLLDH
jgi:AcrR family transcriptional regulator